MVNSWFVKLLTPTILLYLDYIWMSQTRRASWRSKPSSKKKKEGCMFLSTSSCDRFIAGWDNWLLMLSYISAGQLGPTSPFLDNQEAPENKSAESLGTALFNCQSFESWSSHSSVNLASIFFVTTAFLGLLAKGSEDIPGYWSSVINITSISGILKLSQNHVRLTFLPHCLYLIQSYKVLLQQCKGGCIASHKTSLDGDWVERHSRARKRNRPWSLRVGNVVDWWQPFAYTCKKSWKVSFPLLTFSHVKLVKIFDDSGQEMAGTVVYLASRAGGYVHGHEIVIDGGYTAVHPSRAWVYKYSN